MTDADHDPLGIWHTFYVRPKYGVSDEIEQPDYESAVVLANKLAKLMPDCEWIVRRQARFESRVVYEIVFES